MKSHRGRARPGKILWKKIRLDAGAHGRSGVNARARERASGSLTGSTAIAVRPLSVASLNLESGLLKGIPAGE